MFARHLIGAGEAAVLEGGWEYSERGLYAQGGQLYVHDYDREQGILYSYPVPGALPMTGRSIVSSDGLLLTSGGQVPSGKIGLYLPDEEGELGSPLTLYPLPSSGTFFGGAAPSTAIFSDVSGGTTGITIRDLATGDARVFPYRTTTFGGFNSGDDIYVSMDLSVAIPSTDGGFTYTILPSGSGRAQRLTVPRQVYEDTGRSLLWRVHANRAADPMPVVAWRRPLTSATVVRGVVIGALAVGERLARRVVRRNTIFLPIQLASYELEVGASTGTVVVGGETTTRHEMRLYTSRVTGWIKIRGDQVTFLSTRSRNEDYSTSVLQYQNGSSPSGEFIREEFGLWPSSTGSGTRVGVPDTGQSTVETMGDGSPLLVTANNLIRQGQNGWELLTLDGALVDAYPGAPLSYGAISHLQSSDLLISGSNGSSDIRVSENLGRTWRNVKGYRTPPGSPPPTFPPNGANPIGSDTGAITYAYPQFRT